MRRPIIAKLATAAVVAGVILGVGGAASGAPQVSTLPGSLLAGFSPVVARSQLRLTLTPGEKARPVGQAESLQCGPAGGSHPTPHQACAALAAVNGHFEDLHVNGGACTMIYDPVTVTASGRWRGTQVRYQHTFSNPCFLHLETGPVFTF